MTVQSRNFIVHGRVQGVFFRASTRTEANRLGLTGYARNLVDGTVEVLAVGDEAAIDQLYRWLRTGPPMADVERVEAGPLQSVGSAVAASGFTIG
jgi:acylphosphatase